MLTIPPERLVLHVMVLHILCTSIALSNLLVFIFVICPHVELLVFYHVLLTSTLIISATTVEHTSRLETKKKKVKTIHLIDV